MVRYISVISRIIYIKGDGSKIIRRFRCVKTTLTYVKPKLLFAHA